MRRAAITALALCALTFSSAAAAPEYWVVLRVGTSIVQIEGQLTATAGGWDFAAPGFACSIRGQNLAGAPLAQWKCEGRSPRAAPGGGETAWRASGEVELATHAGKDDEAVGSGEPGWGSGQTNGGAEEAAEFRFGPL